MCLWERPARSIRGQHTRVTVMQSDFPGAYLRISRIACTSISHYIAAILCIIIIQNRTISHTRDITHAVSHLYFLSQVDGWWGKEMMTGHAEGVCGWCGQRTARVVAGPVMVPELSTSYARLQHCSPSPFSISFLLVLLLPDSRCNHVLPLSHFCSLVRLTFALSYSLTLASRQLLALSCFLLLLLVSRSNLCSIFHFLLSLSLSPSL